MSHSCHIPSGFFLDTLWQYLHFPLTLITFKIFQFTVIFLLLFSVFQNLLGLSIFQCVSIFFLLLISIFITSFVTSSVLLLFSVTFQYHLEISSILWFSSTFIYFLKIFYHGRNVKKTSSSQNTRIEKIN